MKEIIEFFYFELGRIKFENSKFNALRFKVMVTNDSFDYDSLDIEIREEVKRISEEIREISLQSGSLKKITSQTALELGTCLIELRHLLKGRKLWKEWLDKSNLVTKVRAYPMITVAETEQWKNLTPDQLNLIPTSALYMLSEGAVPDLERVKIVEKVKNGQSITVTQADQIRHKYRKHRRSVDSETGYSEKSFQLISQFFKDNNFVIEEVTLKRYHSSLKTRFVILAGISGIGKTKLATQYAKAIEAESEVIEVAPNWTTNEDILGYSNPLKQGEYQDTPCSLFLRQAAKEYEEATSEGRNPIPYHLILDEMNLARIEYYLAKILSAMERSMDGVEINFTTEDKIQFPGNLYIIGTINVDETTQTISDKVYDRFQLVEISISKQLVSNYIRDFSPNFSEEVEEFLIKLWEIFQPVSCFGFRVIHQIKIYVEIRESLKEENQETDSYLQALDEQIVQKILPKFRGSGEKAEKVLEEFISFAEDKNLKLSIEKANLIQERYKLNGFISYF